MYNGARRGNRQGGILRRRVDEYVRCVVHRAGPDGTLWAMTMSMERAGTSMRDGMRFQAEAYAVVELSDRVRRAGATHVCDENCVAHP